VKTLLPQPGLNVEIQPRQEAGTWRRRGRSISLYRRHDHQACRNALQQDANT